METMYDVLDRFRKKYYIRQTDVAWLTVKPDGSRISSNIMGTWNSRGSFSRTLPFISDTFFLSLDYLSGHSDIKWRPDLLQAQHELREWARTQDLRDTSISGRFIAVWDKWQTLLPMREEIWAVFTGLCEQIPGRSDPPLDFTKWYACKQGTNPTRYNIDLVVDLTGLPYRWWDTGNSVLLRKLTQDEINDLQTFMAENMLDVEHVKNAILTRTE